MAVAAIGWIQFDCADPERLASFWAELLGQPVAERVGTAPGGPRYVVLASARGSEPALAFQWVPEPKTTKNRVHLDVVAAAGLEDVTAWVEARGGPEGDFQEGHWRWRVMRDSEGNEFCLIPPPDPAA